MASILIVDDEANIRSTLKGALAREGYQVDDAPSVAAARTLLREAYDVVLLDVWFPGESGKGFIGRFQPYIGAGIGAVIPHVESNVGGIAFEQYQWDGPGVQVFAGASFDLTRHWSVFAEYKFSYVDLDLHIPNGSIQVTPLMHHVAAGISLRF